MNADIMGWGSEVDLTYLQSFAQVIESGSITKAAWELHLSQSAVSKHV